MEWRPVVGWEDRYEVSESGKVRTRMRAIPCVTPDGLKTFRVLPANHLRFSYGGRNATYRRVMLHGDGIRRHAYVHHLVAEAWHGERPDGTLVCHRDDDATNNTPANLYYGTQRENENDKAVNTLTAAHHHDVELVGCDW